MCMLIKLKRTDRSTDSATMSSAQEQAVYVGNAVKNLLTLVLGSVILALSAALRVLGGSLFFAWDWVMEQSGRKRIILDRQNKDPYLVRYYLLFRNRAYSFPFNVFIHRFIKGDDDHVHDHPWGYFTYILAGGYHETVWSSDSRKGEDKHCTHWRAPGFYQKVSPHHIHKITLDSNAPPCWTLFIPFRRSRDWGFYTKNEDGKTIWTKADDYLKIQTPNERPKGKEKPEQSEQSEQSECCTLRTRSQTQLSKKDA